MYGDLELRVGRLGFQSQGPGLLLVLCRVRSCDFLAALEMVPQPRDPSVLREPVSSHSTGEGALMFA